MTHPGSGRLQSFIDEELSPGAREGVERHLEQCDECVAHVRRLRRAAHDVRLVLEEIHEPMPTPVDEAFAEVGRRASRRRSERGNSRLRSHVPILKAAALVVLFATAASAAIPGSPVRDWIETVFVDAGLRSTAEQRDGENTARMNEPAAASAIAAVRPEDGQIDLSITRARSGTRIEVRLADLPDARVFVLGDAVVGGIRSAPGRLELDAGSTTHLRVDLPSNVRARLSVNGRSVARVAGDSLMAAVRGVEHQTAGFVFRVSTAGGSNSRGGEPEPL